MIWTIREERGVFVATVGTDRLDAAATAALRHEGRSAIASAKPMALDLSRVAFADSSGLGWLCGLRQGAGADRISIVGVGPRLAAILDRLPRSRLPPRVADAEEAVLLLEDLDREGAADPTDPVTSWGEAVHA